jgi:glycosyltransferase involved in cell wall biosynthesis
MIRVLHLVGPNASVATSTGVGILSRASEQMKSAVFRIGRGGDFRSALSAAATLRFAPVPFNIVHAWDRDAFLAAIGGGGPVVYSVDTALSTGELSWLAAAAAPNVRLVAASTWAAAELEESGVPTEHLDTILPATMSPPVAPDAAARTALRAELGLSETDFVLLAPGESLRSANHAAALHAVSILHVLNPRFRLLLWGRGPMTRGLSNLSRRLGHQHIVICADRIHPSRFSLNDLAATSDVALFCATEPAPTTSIIACAVAGLPIIAFDTRLSRELFPGTCVIKVLPPKPRVLAQAVLQLSEDPAKASQLAASIQTHAAAQFDPERYRSAYASVYQELLSDTSIAASRLQAV